VKLNSRITGLEDFGARLERIVETSALREQVRAGAEEVRDAARAQLEDGQPPDSDTGALARSLAISVSREGAEATLSTPLDYGWHLEFGTLDRPATPWMQPAFEDIRPGIVRQIRAWLARSGAHGRRR